MATQRFDTYINNLNIVDLDSIAKLIAVTANGSIVTANGSFGLTGPVEMSNVVGLEDALLLKANLSSPDFTGTPTGPTASVGANTTQLATTAFVQAAIPGQVYTTRTALKAAATSVGRVYLSEAGREGFFAWKAGNYSSQVTADTQEGIYIKADSTASSSGAWVRVFTGDMNARWFGATGDGTTDDSTAIQIAINVAFLNGDTLYVPAGDYVIGTTINMNGFNSGIGANLPSLYSKRMKIIGDGSGSTRFIGGEISYGFFELIDSNYMYFKGFSVVSTRTSSLPQYGFMGGRTTGNNSSGNHIFRDVFVLGRFTKAGAFFLSSEVNNFSDCLMFPLTGHGCVMAMNNSDWALTPKYGTFGSGLGGNGANQFDNCLFLSASTSSATDVLLALEYAQNFRLTSCYFVSSHMNAQIFLRKSASGTMENIFSETQGSFDPYTVYFAPDDSGDATDYIDYRDITVISSRMLRIYGSDNVRVSNMQVMSTVFRGNIDTTYHIDIGKLYDSRIEISNLLGNVTLNTNQKIRIRQEGYNNEISGTGLANIEAPYPSLNAFRLVENDKMALASAYNQGGILTNTTSNYSGVTATLLSGNVPGTNDFSMYVDFICPNTTDSNIRMVCGLGGATTNLGGTNTFSVYVSNGNLYIRSLGPTSAGENTFRCSDSGFVAKFANKRVKLLIVRTGSTPIVYINGYQVKIEQSFTAGGRLWTDTIAGNIVMIGFQGFATTSTLATHYFAAGLFNYALSQSAANALTTTGLSIAENWGTVFGGGTDGCIGWWDFEAGGGTTIFDQSVHAQTATISGNAVRKQNGIRRNQYRTNAGSPAGSLTPAYIGEYCLNTSNNVWYKSIGLTNTSWVGLAPLVDPAFTGTPTAPTATTGTNTTQLATTAFVQSEIVSGKIPTYVSVATAQAATIAATVKTIETQYYAPVFTTATTLVGGGKYVRMSKSVIDSGGYPALSYFRSTDRFMPDGSTDSTNGGYWVLFVEEPCVTQLGAIGNNSTDCSAAFQAATFFKSFKIPAGNFLVNSSITLPSKTKVKGSGVDVTFITSGVVGNSLFKTQVDTTFICISDMTLLGNSLTGVSGNGHAINFVDPVSSGGTFSPQQAVIERLRITGFKGQDIRQTDVATTIMSAGIICYNTLQNVFRDIYISECGHGFYMERAQNCRIDNCAVAGATKFALVAYNNENLIVENCDLVNSADGTADTGYPSTSFSWGSAILLDYGNDSFIFRNNKIKSNYAGSALIRAFNSRGSVYDSNWIRPDAVTDVTHKGMYLQETFGTKIINNEFYPAYTGFTTKKYEMIEVYNTQSAATMLIEIAGNFFGDVAGMSVAYNIKLNGNSNSRTIQAIIEKNQFGFTSSSSSAGTVDADIVIASCSLQSSIIGNNLHVAGTNITRTVCVTASSYTMTDTYIGPSRFIANGGTLTAQYSGIADNNGVAVYALKSATIANTHTATFSYSSGLHLDRIVPFNVAANTNVTLPGTSSVGSRFKLYQQNTGSAVFVASGGAILKSLNSYTKSAGTDAVVEAFVVSNAAGNNAVWVVSGNLIS
jgi:hypothetical protein